MFTWRKSQVKRRFKISLADFHSDNFYNRIGAFSCPPTLAQGHGPPLGNHRRGGRLPRGPRGGREACRGPRGGGRGPARRPPPGHGQDAPREGGDGEQVHRPGGKACFNRWLLFRFRQQFYIVDLYIYILYFIIYIIILFFYILY